MGNRGPLTMPGSRRGERAARRERKTGTPKFAGVTPQPPDWLPAAVLPIWERVIADLQDAGVPLERVDGQAIGFYCNCIHQTAQAVLAGDTKLSARLSRDAITWSGLIGASPAARARLGVKPTTIPRPNKWAKFAATEDDEWDQLDAMRRKTI